MKSLDLGDDREFHRAIEETTVMLSLEDDHKQRFFGFQNDGVSTTNIDHILCTLFLFCQVLIIEDHDKK
jgi:hypothetical protein